jgi:cullin-4
MWLTCGGVCVWSSRAEDLQRMYSLSSRKEKGVEEMKAAFNAYLRKRGAEVVQDEAREKEMVESLLAFKAKADALLEKAFARNELFVYSLKDAFEYVLNARQVRGCPWHTCTLNPQLPTCNPPSLVMSLSVPDGVYV